MIIITILAQQLMPDTAGHCFIANLFQVELQYGTTLNGRGLLQLYSYLKQTNTYFGSKPPGLPTPIEAGSLLNSTPPLADQNWVQNKAKK